jgi:carboxyl-terminal processing protease
MVRWIARLTGQRLQLPPTAVILEYTCGATNALDTYSAFLTGDQLDDVYSQIEGNFVGLGIELKADQGSLLIADVIPKGPAERAGIRPGDRITAVDGTSTSETSTDVAADLLKGEQGTYVLVTLLDPAGNTRQLNVRRERVEVPSLEDTQMLDSRSGVAYFRISSFQKTTSRDVDAALWRLHREGMRSLIVDVRGNPGGLLTEAVEVADRFLTEGTIVTTHGRSVRENYDYRAHRVGTWRVPLVVLIDGDSASASEIFAGAIRDHHRGTVVGERSYGKGSVQGIFPLRVVKGGVRLTTAKFYSPSGYSISQGGIDPDVAVRVVSKPVTIGLDQLSTDDPVLNAGIKVARDLLARRDAQPSPTINRATDPASQAGIPSSAAGRWSW